LLSSHAYQNPTAGKKVQYPALALQMSRVFPVITKLLAAAAFAANDHHEAASIVADSLETPGKLDIIFNEALQVIFWRREDSHP
jgi:hypothetical protein